MERRFWVGRSLQRQHCPWLLFPVLLSCTITTGPPAGSQPAQTPPPAPAATAPPPATAPPASPPSPAPATAGAAPASSATEPYDPCAGKKCGDRCNLCPPKTPGCFETALVKLCHPDNQCKPATTVDCSKPAGG